MDFGKKRLGNWVVTKYSKDGVPFIKVCPVSGEYLWEYSSLDEMFMKIEAAMDDGSGHDGLQTCLGIMGGFIHAADPVFYDLYWKCMMEYEKIAEVVKPVTREDERRIIDELMVEYDIAEELKRQRKG